MLSAAVIAATAFAPTTAYPGVQLTPMRTSTPIMGMGESRRAALLGLTAAAASMATPVWADSIEDIAARNAAAAAKAREVADATPEGASASL